VEHYEIASYGTLVSWAKQLGETEAASLLEETLNEEKEADVALTEVAEGSINEEAEELQSDKENGSHTMVKSKKRK
jgi:ferritin-like metal-binding protein YciE